MAFTQVNSTTEVIYCWVRNKPFTPTKCELSKMIYIFEILLFHSVQGTEWLSIGDRKVGLDNENMIYKIMSSFLNDEKGISNGYSDEFKLFVVVFIHAILN